MQDISTKIEDLLNGIYNDEITIQTIINEVKRIALKLDDPITYYVTELDSVSSLKSQRDSTFNLKERLSKKGYSSEQIKSISIHAHYDWMERRSVEEENDKGEEMHCILSVNEMENSIDRFKQELKNLKIPEQLTGVDAYFKKESYDKKHVFLTEQILKYQNILDRIKQYYINYLIDLESSKELNDIITEKEETTMIDNNKVFIIHGDNKHHWLELKNILENRTNLTCIELSEMPGGSLTLIDKFEKYAEECAIAIAILSAEDRIVKSEEKEYSQARPNVLFELGWFYHKLGKERILILYEDIDGNIIPSDLSGMQYLPFKGNVSDAYYNLENELRALGILEQVSENRIQN
jgi:predicted nucleotide-binding protein